MEPKMSEITKERLANLKKLLKAEKADPNGSERYIEDLNVSIKHCELALAGPKIITGAV